MASATSSAVAVRLNGLWARIASPPGPDRMVSVMSVAMNPGAIDVTVMSCGASETANDWPSECSPALAAPYAGTSGSPR